jgi:SulP family sulfate permease
MAAREVLAGLVGSIVLITNIVSFGALMFPGALAAGAPTAIWAMLIGGAVVGLWVSWKTTLPPLASGIDSPTGAVLALVAAAVAQAVLSSGGAAPQAIQATMLIFTAATALSGVLLLGLGLAGRSAYLRFVPFFVIAGFLGATGWLLIAGGIRITTGRGVLDLLASASGSELLRLACAVGVCIVLLAQRRWVRWPLALPAALAAMTVLTSVVLELLGLSDPVHGWYLPSLGTLTPWRPLQAANADPATLSMVLRFVPEMLAIAIVAMLSLVTKTASLEVARKASSDLDNELRAHGLATLVTVPLGGIVSSMQLGSSRLLDSSGGLTRWAGVASALLLGAVGLLNLDLLSLIPIPIAAGLVFYLGYGFLVEAFSKSLARRDWLNLVLALVIAAACVRFGYVVGVIGGVVCACLLFAVSYARVGAVRQHLSRAQFAGNVSRSTEASRYLSETGEAIQIYWLSGYIFFGSSEAVFERVRRDLLALAAGRVRHVILDFGMVPAADASATVSLAKLRDFCRKHGAVLVFSGLAPGLRSALERDGFFKGRDAPAPFADVTTALAWSEDALLARGGDAASGAVAMEAWLQQQLGAEAPMAEFLPYLEKRHFEDGQVVYRQGEAADAIDLVASGRLGIEVAVAGGRTLRLRSITTQTVVGEMGFFGQAARSATVTAEGPVTVWTLTRSSFERLRREQPDVASAFYEFLLRTLADRIRLTEKMVTAMRL